MFWKVGRVRDIKCIHKQGDVIFHVLVHLNNNTGWEVCLSSKEIDLFVWLWNNSFIYNISCITLHRTFGMSIFPVLSISLVLSWPSCYRNGDQWSCLTAPILFLSGWLTVLEYLGQSVAYGPGWDSLFCIMGGKLSI